jgi:hypothetical protein
MLMSPKLILVLGKQQRHHILNINFPSFIQACLADTYDFVPTHRYQEETAL